MNFEIIDYVELNEERRLGVIRISYGSILLSFNVTKKKDGSGVFIVAPSIKVGGTQEEPKYRESFEIDSRAEHAKITSALHEYIENYYNPQASVHQPVNQPAGFKQQSGHHSYLNNNTQQGQQGGWSSGKAQDNNLPF